MTVVAISLATASFLGESTVFGGVAFTVVACAGIVATRLVRRSHVAALLDPVSVWALAAVSSGEGWGLLLAGSTHQTGLFMGGAVLGGALVGVLRVHTRRRLYPIHAAT